MENKLSDMPAQVAADQTEEKISFLTLEQYQTIVSEQEKKGSQDLAAKILDELKYQGETAAVETFSYMIRMGLIISRNGTTGKVKILPIIGRGHWQLESWEKFRQLIQKDKKSVMPIVRAIRLFENGKLRYNAEKVSTKKNDKTIVK